VIKTKHGSRIDVVGTFPEFKDYKRVVIEFHETGRRTWMNVADLVESKEGEVQAAIDRINRKGNQENF